MEIACPEPEEKADEEADKMSLDGFVSKTRKLSISEEEPSPVRASSRGNCAVCCKDTSFRCARCGAAFYCSRSHQRQHWPEHGAKCPLQRLVNGAEDQPDAFWESKIGQPSWNPTNTKKRKPDTDSRTVPADTLESQQKTEEEEELAILDLSAMPKGSQVANAAGLGLCVQTASAVIPDECAAVLGAEDAADLAEAVSHEEPQESMNIEDGESRQKTSEDVGAFQTPPRKKRAKSEDVQCRKEDTAITLDRLLEMGFDYESARAALKQEDLTAEKAINFLLKGELPPYTSYGGIRRTPSPEGVADIEEGTSVGLDLEARAGVVELRSDEASTIEEEAKTDELYSSGPLDGVENWEEKLRKLMEMGFPRERCIAALQKYKTLNMAADALLTSSDIELTRAWDSSFQALD